MSWLSPKYDVSRADSLLCGRPRSSKIAQARKALPRKVNASIGVSRSEIPKRIVEELALRARNVA